MIRPRSIAILGLSITSSWGNGHASTWRALVRELVRRGHDVHFLERDVPWYRHARDLPRPPWGHTALYTGLETLREHHARLLSEADVVVVGSYVPDGAAICDWLFETRPGPVVFYDIDTPVTLDGLAEGRCPYLRPDQVGRFALYLSFAGGASLGVLRRRYGAREARALYCSVDPACHYPAPDAPLRWDLGYIGTWSGDRQPALERLLVEPALRLPDRGFVVAGSSYPSSTVWAPNIERIEHLAPGAHRGFYASQRYTLNVTRAAMVRAGHAPSVRLFEAAACGTAVISDRWPGIESLFEPDREIRLVDRAEDVVAILAQEPEEARLARAERARNRVLASHTAAHRAATFESCIEGILDRHARSTAIHPAGRPAGGVPSGP